MTTVFNLKTFVAVNDARFENQLCASLAYVDVTPICYFLDQLKQIDLVVSQAWIYVI